jgi:membrane glycosyltransferase
MAFGLLLAAAAYAVSLPLFLWMLPVLIGLVLAVPLAALTASRAIGLALRRLGLLRIAEESTPPPVMQTAAALYRRLQDAPEADGIARLLGDHALLRHHRAMLPPPPDRRAPIDVPLVVGLAKLARAERLDEAAAELTRPEKAALLGNRDALDRLRALARPDSQL